MVRFAAVEGGGTTWVAAICENAPDNIIDRCSFPTMSNPVETLGEIKQWLSTRQFDSIGVGTFGPVDCDPNSPFYGFITSTPKPGWKNTDVLGLLGVRQFGKPFKFDTDVNAPALAEYFLHRDSGLKSCAYITIGTGIGVGLVIDGKTVHGLLHPEAGHIRVGREIGDEFAGNCPYHSDCVEGMCASGALALRKGIDAAALPDVPDNDPLWTTCAFYLAQLCANLVLIASPERISIGGGIMQRKSLYPKIRELMMKQLNGYIQNDKLLTLSALESYIGPSCWDSNAGLVGVAYLARVALTEHNEKVRRLVQETIEKENKKTDVAASTLNGVILIAVPVLAALYAGFLVFTRKR